MAQLLKDGHAIENSWQTVASGETTFPAGDILVSLDHWREHKAELTKHSGSVGLWIQGNEEIEAVVDTLTKMPVIAVVFPKFADGRGFSIARLLRERYDYQGEIRAIGNIIRDQLYLLQRCGFNGFELEAGIDLTEAAKSLQDFSDAYQVAVDQPVPLFKRR